MKRPADIEASRKEYLALSDSEWRKDYIDETTGGFVATHILKEMDNLHRTGIVAEVNACFELAKTRKLFGKRKKADKALPKLVT